MKSLETGKQEVLRRISALGPDSARRWGKMSCHQMIVHLTDSFLCGLGEKTASPKRLPVPAGVAKWGALYFPMPWPKGLPTRPEMEQGVGGTAPVEFSADRERLAAVIERFAVYKGQWAEHPIFGAMRQKDWLRWGYLHCDHHLRQFGN